MLHQTLPWRRLTRTGIPPMAVIRRPLRIDFGEPLPVGAAYPSPDPANLVAVRRARQYYEARKIAPSMGDIKVPDVPAPEVLAENAPLTGTMILPEAKPFIRPTLPKRK